MTLVKPAYRTESLGWREIREGRALDVKFRLEEAGIVEVDLLARSESDWRVEKFESSALRLYVQGEYNQDVILFYGDRPFRYKRLLGFLEAGDYELRIEFNRDISSPEVVRAFVENVEWNVVTRESELFAVYRHAPVLYGRNLTHPYENRFTDTPLLLFYRIEPEGDRTAIEYHIIFSHEDEGTPTPLLMSKWGRTTDIEWIYRVVLDERGEAVEATYQGLKHVTGHHRGNRALGGHPVLQSASAHGMVIDEVKSDYRFLFPPARRWNPEAEPRERVMDDFPFTYQVTAWEMLRQYPVEQPVIANSFHLADLRHYMFVQSAKVTERDSERTSIDIQVKLKGRDGWFSSSFGDLRYGNFRCSYDGPYAQFSTAVKLPPGTSFADIEQICAVWLPGGEDSVLVPEFKAMFLDEQYAPGETVYGQGPVRVTKEEPRQTVWRGDAR